MKVTLKSHHITVTAESDYESGSIQDYFEAFRGCLIAITFQPETIDQYIIEWAEEIREKNLVNEKESEDYNIKSCKD